MNTPTLTDGLVVLNAHVESDIDAHLAGEDDEHARRFGWYPQRSTHESVRLAIARWQSHWEHGGITRTFAVRADGELAGGVELRLAEPDHAELAYWVFPQFRSQGIATRAVRLVCRYGLDQLDQESIQAFVEPDNVASRSVALGAGFQEDPALHRHALNAEETVDMVRYLLR